MAELVQIPLANAEYVARFERPYIGFIANERARVIEVVFNALLPFNMRLADIDIGCPKAASRAQLSCPGFGPHYRLTTQYLGQLMGFSA
jgi:hypothetical protein